MIDLGRAWGGTVTVVAVGEDAYAGVDAVRTLTLPPGTPAEAAAPAVAAAVTAEPGDLVLAPNRAAERVLAGAVAARLNAPVVTGVSAVAPGSLTVERFGGITEETLASPAPVVIVAAGGAEASGDPVSASAIEAETLPATVTEESTTQSDSTDLAAAKRIVSVGRGFKASGDLDLARTLASALDAELCCSRPLAEGVGWMPKESYVGVSGQVVKPDLYLAVGISGQLQHMVGARDARTIVAINADSSAPIFSHADYGVVGDLYEVLPALTDALA
ncbi:electron transfer flavoprotein subunit alpha/FixB family protein [Propioniciclava sp.]|uniref:electron transfer flavoprotein subunit alpha/FixB family protein n=1 Tax=Propioniciclava sp. TaxID=2038686 RepID=UPI0039E3A87A